MVDVLLEAAAQIDGIQRRELARVLVRSVSSARWIVSLQLWHHPLHGPTVVSDGVRDVAATLADAGIEAVVVAAHRERPLVTSEPL